MGKDSYALITGVFLIILVTAVVAIIIWLGDFQAQTDTYIVATKNSVTGLRAGSTVYYRGIAVGKVDTVTFDPNRQQVILVPIAINKGIHLTRGVYASLQLKGVTGLTQIALQDSGENPELLPPGDDPANRIQIKPSLLDRLSDRGEDILLKSSALMTRLNSLLNDENEQHIGHILANVDTATRQFIQLEDQARGTLQTLPALTAELRRTLAHVDALVAETKDVAQQLKSLAPEVEILVQSGTAVSDAMVQTTLPRLNVLLIDLQSTSRRFKHVAMMLEHEPQAILIGRDESAPGPGEPGYKEP